MIILTEAYQTLPELKNKLSQFDQEFRVIIHVNETLTTFNTPLIRKCLEKFHTSKY